jgi:hypothetical protein
MTIIIPDHQSKLGFVQTATRTWGRDTAYGPTFLSAAPFQFQTFYTKDLLLFLRSMSVLNAKRDWCLWHFASVLPSLRRQFSADPIVPSLCVRRGDCAWKGTEIQAFYYSVAISSHQAR